MTWPEPVVQAVLTLKAQGLTDIEVSAATGVPVGTIRTWRYRSVPRAAYAVRCPRCRAPGHDWEALSGYDYAYLLGLYLGDGTITRWGAGRNLQIALDTAYPGIIAECVTAICIIRGAAPVVRPQPGKACVRVTSSWVSWPCVFPQHGHGRKHTRAIELVDWQQAMVAAEPGRFLRGLIHSDGWRGINHVRAKGRDYAYPRYQFSNRSDDIRRLFTDACDRLGVDWRPWTAFHVAVSRANAVAILDQHVGIKE